MFTLGDNVYDNGLLTEFTNCYTPSWGQASIKSRTRPITGNHDFGNGSNNGDGYFDYFNGTGQANGPAGPRNTGFYSYDVGPHWHVVVLNSECANAGVGCTRGLAPGDLAARRPRRQRRQERDRDDPPAALQLGRQQRQHRARARCGRTSTTTASSWSSRATTTTTSGSPR